jgi:thioesterase domain-containing protein
MLKEKTGSDRHFFLIHEGSGEVEGYIELCSRLTSNFNVWGINADRLENYAPKHLTIEDVALYYVNILQKIQPTGPYFIAGWSIGGTIAFEIARYLEQTGEIVKLLALIDAAPPHRRLKRNIEEFTVESELMWARKYLHSDIIEEKLKDVIGT